MHKYAPICTLFPPPGRYCSFSNRFLSAKNSSTSIFATAGDPPAGTAPSFLPPSASRGSILSPRHSRPSSFIWQLVEQACEPSSTSPIVDRLREQQVGADLSRARQRIASTEQQTISWVLILQRGKPIVRAHLVHNGLISLLQASNSALLSR